MTAHMNNKIVHDFHNFNYKYVRPTPTKHLQIFVVRYDANFLLHFLIGLDFA